MISKTSLDGDGDVRLTVFSLTNSAMKTNSTVVSFVRLARAACMQWERRCGHGGLGLISCGIPEHLSFAYSAVLCLVLLNENTDIKSAGAWFVALCYAS